MAEGNKGTVCVTGASGFIASWLVKLLLEKGYTVRGTVRNPEKAKHLLELPGAAERFQLIAADLLEPGAFDSAVQDCDGVFHTASPVLPVFQSVANPQAQLLDPAVKGTLNVLESCAKYRPKRIVLTSSMAAVTRTPKCTPTAIVDESMFSDPVYLRETKSWYSLSKTLAEETAWKFVKEHKLDMVTINPTFVTGPILQGSINDTSEIILDFLTGKAKTYPDSAGGWVGVKDVAKAHILAYEKPEAEGRHIVCERVLLFGELVALLAKLYPQYPVIAKEVGLTHQAFAYKFSTEKVEKLGLTFEPLEDVIHETVNCFKSLNLLD